MYAANITGNVKRYLHQDPRPLRGREGNFVHKMRDVPEKEKKKKEKNGGMRGQKQQQLEAE